MTFYLKTKRLLVTVIEKGKPAGHPFYIEKSVLKQIWENYIRPLFVVYGMINFIIHIWWLL